MGTSSVQIKGGPVGLDSIVVDGEDISKKITSVTVSTAGAREVTQVHFTTIADVDLDIEGAVVVHDSEADNAAAMKGFVEWLESRDADEIEQMALAKMGMGDSGSAFTQNVISILADMVREASGSTD